MTGKRQADSKKKRQKNVRPTVGLLTAGISGELGTSFLAGVADAAVEQDANLITFPGEILNSPNGFEAQANVLYDLVTAGVVDGLVLDGGLLSHYIGPEELQDFCTRYGDIPLVSVEVPLAGNPSVLTDFYQGMRQVMTHLIEEHGYRRIAFIRGPEESPTAQDRYRAYQDALAEHDIPLDMDLVAPGIFFAPSGEEAVRLLLDERKVEFEAVAAGNDFMAVDAMQALQARGIRVPADVAVTGFDNFGVASVVAPPLTTARLDNYGRAQQAAEILLTQLGGEAAPEQVARPAEVVVRQSCGCPSLAVVETAAGPVQPADEPLEVVLVQQREQILSEMEQVGSFTKQAGQWAEQLLDAFTAELAGEATGAFLSAWTEVLSQVAAAGHASRGPRHSVTAWQGVLSVLRRHVMPALGSQAAFAQAEDLWQQARVMIGETAERIQLYRNLESEQQAEVLREVGQMLIATHEVAELMDTLVEQLPRLGIKGCYLSLYEDPRSPAAWARLALAYREGERLVLDEEKKRFASPQLMPEGLLPQDRRYELIVEPLYFRERQIGFAVFEFEQGTPQKGLISEALRGQISSALKSALLVQQEEKRARQLQTVAEVGTATSTILDTADLLQQVVNLTKEQFGLYHAHIYLLDTATNDLVLAAGAGEIGRKMVAEGWRIPLKREQSLVARAARDQAGVIVNNVQEEPGWLPNKDLPQTRSELAVPLLVGERVLGVLDVQSDEVDHFTADDIQIQMTLAAQVATALENARLFEQAQRSDFLLRERVKELDCLNDIGRKMEENPPPLPELLEWITRRIPPAMQFSELALAAIEFEGQVYGEPKAVDLPTQIVHGLYVGGEILGRIYIAYTEKRDFIDEESALLGGIATRVSGFIENRRLFEQTLGALTQVEQSQHFLRTLLDNIPNPVFYKDVNGAYLGFNRAFLEYLGQTEEELMGKTVYDLNTDKELAYRYHEADMAVFRNQGVQVYESTVKHANGTLRDVIFNKAAFTNPDGSLGGLVGVMVDITERKRIEEALRENEARLSDATNIAQLGYWEFDFQTQIFTFTDQLYALLRTTAAQEGGYQMPAMQYAQKFVHPDDAHLVGDEIRQAVETAAPDYSSQVEHRIIRADGSEGFILVRFRIIKDAQGRTIKSIGANQDITERRQAEEELHKLSRAVEQSASTVVITDIKGYIEYVNPRFVETTGYTVEEALGQHTRVLKSGETSGEEYKAMWETIVAGGEWHGQFHNKKKNGELYWESAIVSPIKDEKGEITHFLAVKEEITERKEAEAERERLLAEVQRLAAIVENHPDFIGFGTLDGKILYVNPAGLKMMGLPLDHDVTAMDTNDFHPAVEAEKFVKEELPTALEKGSWSGEANLLKVDGTTIPVDETIGVNYDATGTPYSLSITMRDITKQKVAAEALRVSEERFALAVQGTNDGLWDWDIANNTVFWSPRLKEMLGYADDELDVGLDTLNSLLHPDHKEQMKTAMQAHLKDRVPLSLEVRIRTKSGEYRWHYMRGQAVWGEIGRALRLVGSVTDITERKRTEEALRQSEIRYRTLAENLPIGLYRNTPGPQGKFLMANPALMRTFGYDSLEEFLQIDVADLYPDPIQRKAFSDKLLAQGRVIAEEMNLKRKDGTAVWVANTATAIKDETGQIAYFDGIIENITERKRIEEALRENEARLSDATSIAQLGYWEFDFQTQIFTFTDQLYALLRTTAAQEGGYQMPAMQYAQKFVHPDDAHLVGDEIRQAVETTDPGYSSQVEHRIIRADGSEGFILVRFRIVKDAQGRTIKSIGANQDITERKQAEQERERLLAEVQRLATIVENHPDFIGVGTLEGKPLYLNPAGLRMMGLPLDYDVTAMDALDFFTAKDAERLSKEGIPTALEKGFWSTEANLLRADGKMVPVEETISIQYDADGKPATFSVTMHDISNRQVAEAEQARLLAEVEASYRQYVRQEWEQYLQEQHQGQWHIEHKVQDMPFDADLTPLQEEVIREQATKTISHRPGNGTDVAKSEPAAIVAPLSLRGQVVGTLNLQDAAPDRIWSDEEIALVEAVSEQLALTVENLRLFDDTQRRATREQLTRQITDKIHAAPDVDTIIQTGLTELAKVLGASRTYVKLKPALEQEQNPETLTLVQQNVDINIDEETTP